MNIFNFRKPVSKPLSPVIKSIPKSNPRNIYSLFTSEFAELDLQRIKRYIETARRGLNFWKSLFFEYIRREDLFIGGVCQTRKLSLIGKLRSALRSKGFDSIIQGGEGAIREYIIESYKGVDIANVVSDIVESQLQGLSIFEIDYGVRAGKIVPEKIELVPNHLVLYDDISNEYSILDIRENDSNFMRVLSSNSYGDRIDMSNIKKVEVDPRKLLEVHSYDGNSQNGCMNGCIDSLIIAYYFKRYGISDWSTFLELYATPSRVGKYDPLSATPSDIRALEDGVKNFGANSWAVISNNTDLEFPSTAGKKESSDIYKDYIEYFNNSISIRVLGQTLTTSVGDTGSYAAARVHNTVREDILNSDVMIVEETLNRLNRRLIDLNFSGVTDYPVVVFPETRGIDDKKQLSEILRNLRAAGYEPDIEMLVDEFGFELQKSSEQMTGGSEQKTGGSEQKTGGSEQDIDDIIRELV